MVIRPAQVEDVPAVLPMVESVCSFHRTLDPAKYGFLPEPSKRYERWLEARAQDPRSVLLVAETEADEADAAGRLVGFIVATTEKEIPIYTINEYGFVHDLWVEPDYRNEGIGRKLVLLAIERFRDIGVEQIRLDVAAENEPAQRLFASCGLRPAIIEMLMEIRP